LQAIFMVGKVKSVAALDAKEVIVDPALVTVIASHDLHAGVATAHTKRCLTSIAAVSAGRAHVFHLPGASLVAICARSQRAHGADVDAHAAFFALEVVFLVGYNRRDDAAVVDTQGPNVHALAADAHAAIAQDAARTVKVNDWGPLLLVAVGFEIDIF